MKFDYLYNEDKTWKLKIVKQKFRSGQKNWKSIQKSVKNDKLLVSWEYHQVLGCCWAAYRNGAIHYLHADSVDICNNTCNSLCFLTTFSKNQG